MEKAVILVDENNAMNQFHHIGIEGIQPWVSFYKTTESCIKEKHHRVEEVGYHIYGAVIPRTIDIDRHHIRKRFFKALIRDGINVHKAFCLPDKNYTLVEKGVDMLLGLDIVSKAQEGIKHIYVFSADTDLVPAVQRAQTFGSKITAIVREHQPAELMRRYANNVLVLEDIVRNIPVGNVVTRKGEIAL